MSKERNFTHEEWKRLEELITDRIWPRVSLMQDALRSVTQADPGGEITVSILSLDGVRLMTEDLFREVEESIHILDF